MIRSIRSRLARQLVGRTSVLVTAAAVIAAAISLVLPPRSALICFALIVLFFLGSIVRDGAAFRRLRRDIAVKRAVTDQLDRLARDSASATDIERRAQRVHDAFEGGFPVTGLEAAKEFAVGDKTPAAARIELLRSVLAWYDENDRHPAARRTGFDVVFVSHFGLPGGNTSANAADIRICRDNGLKIGLLHHPIYKWGPNAPLNPRIEELVDGESVTLIGLDEEVDCELAVVRMPTVLMKPLERRPEITAGNVVIIANQTPFKFYGENGPAAKVWDIATVERNLTDWLGPHTWYAGGPLVHRTLLEHHAEAMAGLDLASTPWNECIDIDDWRLGSRRSTDGHIRIGRHSRDHILKWPEDPKTLRQCYPDQEPFEIHILGGADIPARILGEPPANWTVHPFNSLTAKEFLAQIDIMVYFIASDGLEAFGRAPLEAMAAGVPVIMDRRFEPTFGPAAVYCEPSEVADAAERLMSDARAYAAQQSTAWDFLADHFSGRALMERLTSHAPQLKARSERNHDMEPDFTPAV